MNLICPRCKRPVEFIEVTRQDQVITADETWYGAMDPSKFPVVIVMPVRCTVRCHETTWEWDGPLSRFVEMYDYPTHQSITSRSKTEAQKAPPRRTG